MESTLEVTLGSTGLAVTPLGIGTWAWGDKLFWSYGRDYHASELQAAFKTALDLGVGFFDTAEIYGMGESERLLGQFIQQEESPDQPVIIATKYFPLPWRFSADAVADALTASLKRLQLPTVDLYQVHWPFDFFMGQTTLMQALADEVQQGRIRAVGVSNYSAAQMREAHRTLARRGVPLAVNQMQYSLLARQIEQNGVLQTARDLSVTILAYSPLAQGLLTGKYTATNYQPPTGARRFDPRFSQSGLQKLSPLFQSLTHIGANHDRTPAQVALNWLIAQGNVIPIPGAKTAEQVRQNAGALGWSLSAAELDQLATVSQA
ncbi:MAG: aldo/keto reductase [Pegethrix bostrychoides GSE-TBD4-15B]|jgi:aryl-alcohol dehydrogenase-like predicted oxidoreductase|uniref:Aldo/keto reductase n=1 Tax=Pegethrix bostrychoides GSE-TBD4-15B TaxID=2839662 RepID=A0A951U4U2_9CYAN|nr:aldo/keto reductase [Pegethrix bostrychoides GSE-TBD4-15B]